MGVTGSGKTLSSRSYGPPGGAGDERDLPGWCYQRRVRLQYIAAEGGTIVGVLALNPRNAGVEIIFHNRESEVGD